MPAELTKGKEDIYVGWWFRNKVFKPGAIDPEDAAAYALAYARKGRMDAAFDYCRQIIADMEFNKRQFKAKSAIRLLAVGGDHSIANMGEALNGALPCTRDVAPAWSLSWLLLGSSVRAPDSTRFGQRF